MPVLLRRATFLIGFAALTIVSGACTKAPTERMEAAEHAVEQARAANAPSYAQEDFETLQNLLGIARAEVAKQNNRFPLFRDYAKAEQLIEAIQREAARVTAEVTKRKEEARPQALQAHQAAKDAVKTVQKLVAEAPEGKREALVETFQAYVADLDMTLAEAQKALDDGAYTRARRLALSVQQKAHTLGRELQKALGQA